MQKSKTIETQCLCGGVKLRVSSDANEVRACHCNMCRTWGSGPYMSINCGTNVSILNDEKLGIFDSSKWAERGFCTGCGTHLFYRLKASQLYMMSAALLAERDELVFNLQFFIDEKPDYYAFANDNKVMTGAEVFAMVAAKQSPPTVK